jgi:amino acid adenylation domain-containing protein
VLTDAQREALTARLRRGRENLTATIGRRPAGRTDLPLSYGQEQLWFIDKIAPGRGTYNIPYGIRLAGQLDAGALGRALDRLTARHEALRTRLVAGPDGQRAQVIDPASPRLLELADLSGLEPEKRADRLREFIHAEALRPFDLARGPLLRNWLIRLDPDEHMLLTVVHHAVFDGWSTGVFLRELAALYAADVSGTSAGLTELPVQFADYALWERDQLAGGRREALESWWRETLAGLPVVQFPADRPRPILEDYDGGLAQHMTGPGLLEALREVSRQAGTTLNVTLMAGLAALLHRYTGQCDLVVGSFSANRGRPELAPLIGFLVNTLPIRTDVSGDPAFTELLARVSAATIGAYAHQDLPFGKLVEALRLPRDPARAPVFQIALTYADRDASPVPAAGIEFTGSDLVVGIKAAKFDLDLLAEVRPGGLWLECSYKTSLFEARTVRQLLENFEVLLRAAAANPAAPLSRLPVLTEQQRRQELAGWNDTGREYPQPCVHEAFEAQVALAPEAIAAQCEGEVLSYAELNRRANQIARRLRSAGVGPEVLVGVCLPAGLPRLAALLGIWKAGGGYVPLDPALPPERMQYLAADAGLTVVLANADTVDRLPRTGAVALRLDSEWASIGELDGGNLAGSGAGAGAGPGNVAYVIYTSGSTGRPKGVVIEHRQAINFLLGQVEYWRIKPSDIVLQFASLNFDGSVMDTFMPLLGGARVLLGSAETLHSPPRLAALINSRRVTIAHMTPAVLGLLSDRQFPTLHAIGTGGEELPSELARRWIRPGLRLVNDYGPTEAAVTATSMDLDASSPLPPAIGLPLPNYQAYVLDPHLNPVPAGVIGELHIGGAGVARGYLNRPALTAQRFIADPLRPGSGGRLYRTGDLVRRRHDGTIVFLGRSDHQVKIRGLRIELGEVETALASHPAVAQAVVAVVPGPAGDKQLAAYLRPAPGAVPDPAALRAHCARTLPAYMIPVHLITLASFPLNTSGKIDRTALPAPAGSPARRPGGPALDGSAAAGSAAAGSALPGSAMEATVAGLFAAVLGLASAGPDDNFFDVGGSSLQVMRLVDRLNTEAGVDVGVAVVFLHPTPRELAARIDAIRSGAGQAVTASGPLIELTSGVSGGVGGGVGGGAVGSGGGDGTSGGQPPLVLIHPVGGTVFGYAQLVGELAAALGVYGLQAPGLAVGGVTPATLDSLVSDYTERIRSAWPDGPYRLGGWSLGGVIAFEVARRLEQAGAQVTLLALLDAPFAIPAQPNRIQADPFQADPFQADHIQADHIQADHSQPDHFQADPIQADPIQADHSQPDRIQAELASQFLADAWHGLGRDPAALSDPALSDPALSDLNLPGPGLSSVDRQLGWLASQLAGGAEDAGELAVALRRRFDVFQAHHRMVDGYQPTGPAVRAPTLIVSADSSLNAPARDYWPRVLAGPVTTVRLDADHYSFLRPPLAAQVAAAILDLAAKDNHD